MAPTKQEIEAPYGPYTISQKEADTILAKSKGRKVTGDLSSAIAKVQRHRTKWLPAADSTIAIPLSDAEHAAVAKDSGVKLKVYK